jgi:hypothetical protein
VHRFARIAAGCLQNAQRDATPIRKSAYHVPRFEPSSPEPVVAGSEIQAAFLRTINRPVKVIVLTRGYDIP